MTWAASTCASGQGCHDENTRIRPWSQEKNLKFVEGVPTYILIRLGKILEIIFLFGRRSPIIGNFSWVFSVQFPDSSMSTPQLYA